MEKENFNILKTLEQAASCYQIGNDKTALCILLYGREITNGQQTIISGHGKQQK